MARTTIKISDQLDARLRQEAARRGITISELTREAIQSHLGGPKRRLMAAGAANSGRDDISERIEEILRHETGLESLASSSTPGRCTRTSIPGTGTTRRVSTCSRTTREPSSFRPWRSPKSPTLSQPASELNPRCDSLATWLRAHSRSSRCILLTGCGSPSSPASTATCPWALWMPPWSPPPSGSTSRPSRLSTCGTSTSSAPSTARTSTSGRESAPGRVGSRGDPAVMDRSSDRCLNAGLS